MSEQEQQREYERYQEWAAEREAHEEQQYHIYLEGRIEELEAQLSEIAELIPSWNKWAAKAKSKSAKRAAECVIQCANELQAIINREEG